MFTGGIVQSTRILFVPQKCDVSRLLFYIASHIDIALLIIAIENFSLSSNSRKGDKYRYCDSWKCDNNRESNTEKYRRTDINNKAIIVQGATEKVGKYQFESTTFISYFGAPLIISLTVV